MKKIAISILILLLGILMYYIIFNNIRIFKWKNNSIDDLKQMNSELDKRIETAKEKNLQEYPEAISTLEGSIDELKKTKENYENKVKYLSNDVELGIVQIKEYKVDRLWVALGNYAKDENVNLKLDILETSTEGIYDLNVTVDGDYIGITDFIYDIEKDDTLGFKVINFKMVPKTLVTKTEAEVETNTETEEENNETGQTQTSTKQYSSYIDVDTLKATFRIESVGIEFN